MEDEIISIQSTAPKKRTDRVAEREYQPPQRLLKNISTTMSAPLAAEHILQPRRVENNKGNRGRRTARNDWLQQLTDVAKVKADEKHALMEKLKAGKPKRRPSRAITPRQISSKRSAELDRLKKQIYTELLEAKLCELDADNVRTRHMITALSLDSGRIGIRLAEISQKPQVPADDKNKPETPAYSPPLSASWVTGIVSADPVLNRNLIEHRVDIADFTPIATSSEATDDDTMRVINDNQAVLTSSPTITKPLTLQPSQTASSPISANQDTLIEDKLLPVLQGQESHTVVTEQERYEVDTLYTSYDDPNLDLELDIFLHPTSFKSSSCNFDFLS